MNIATNAETRTGQETRDRASEMCLVVVLGGVGCSFLAEKEIVSSARVVSPYGVVIRSINSFKKTDNKEGQL